MKSTISKIIVILPINIKGGDMSGFVRLLLVNFVPRGGAFEVC